MKLRELLTNVAVIEISGDSPVEIKHLVFDSRKVEKDDVFFAISGTMVDGHQFIDMAVERGAAVIVGERLPENFSEAVVFVRVHDSSIALGQMAANFYQRPTEKLRLVGVTGTNGKTSTATLLHGLFLLLGKKSGLLSTIENRIGGEVFPATHTTPDPVRMNALFSEMVKRGCEYAFMEVSSHAIDQNRIAGLHFAGGIFTNITHDHLDYHKTFKNYIRAKKKFFDDLPKGAFALINSDDKNGAVMVQNTAASVHTFALKKPAAFKAKILENSLQGLHLQIDGLEMHTRMIGEFNAYNLLAVYGAAVLLGEERTEVLTRVSQLPPAEGRFDFLVQKEKNLTGIVDYAHTPDALEKVLETLKALNREKAKIITVTGCGGDRDRTKRPIMAKIACEMSDKLILTSDNPRSENPDDIIREMEAGVPAESKSKVLSVTDRRQAIKVAVQLANPGDVILIAGKGHEKYQEIKGVKYPFDDKEELKICFEG